MDIKAFKISFDEAAKGNGFEKSFGGWILESSESIVVLDLQKSNFGNYFELNIKIFIHGIFEKIYIKNKDLKKYPGNVFRRHPPEFKDVLDLDMPLDETIRTQKLNLLFNEFILPFSNLALSRAGIRLLADKREISLLPAVNEALKQL
ncbi:MAG: DUF4304 domain-containing protein [Agriterribacter sp.]